ncbi:armadillo-type protein [Powellomyces hirtus]|nr:armadillo-type protein [Powellomyces hirtus]
MSSWQPRAEDLQLLVQLLKDSTSSDNTVQNNVRQQLETFTKIPEYPNYLACVMAMVELEASTRAIAGLTLKNYLRVHIANMQSAALEFVKSVVVRVVSDDQEPVRAAAGSIITTILSLGLALWPEVLNVLVQLIDSPRIDAVEGAFGALQKICEDSARQLDNEQPQALGFMIQKFIQHFSSPSWKVRAAAIQCCNQFVVMHSQGLMVNMEAYVQGLYERAGDEDPHVRKNVCQAMVMILENVPEALIPQLDNVVKFMLYCTDKQADDEVALEACEFWLSFAEQDQLRDNLEKYLPDVIPVLLKGMVYAEDDLIILIQEAEADDAAVPDGPQDIKPRHHKARAHAFEHESSAQQAAGGADGNEDDDSESDWDEDEDGEDVYNEWNLRKCSAAALDVFATVYENDLLPYLLPRLKEELFHQEWVHRECGILALGAIAEGCLPGMMPHLPQLVPHLISCLRDAQPLVRAITCWTLGRYAGWTVEPPVTWRNQFCQTDELLHQHRDTYFKPLVLTLLQNVLDNNKRVQEAACSALATVEEDATTHLAPFLEAILSTLSMAFGKYQDKNLLILYDAVGTLADSVGGLLREERFIHILMGPLHHKWQMIQDMERGIFPLFECMSSVAVALGPHFAPFAADVWQRCLRIIQFTLQYHQNPQAYPTIHEEPDKDFIVVSLDLLSGVAQGMGEQVQPLVSQFQPPVLSILPVCMHDNISAVRQSAFALLGDLAISAFPVLKPHLNQYLPELIDQLQFKNDDPTEVSVINNAAWASGEIALKYEGEMANWIPNLLERLVRLLNNRNPDQIVTPKAVRENAAITIGRLGLVCPELVAPHLSTFIAAWCEALRDIRDNLEKESAFQGLCRMIKLNPNGVIDSFVYFCDAVALWQRLSPELKKEFETILVGFKTGFGAQWEPMWNNVPLHIKQRLHDRYGL